MERPHELDAGVLDDGDERLLFPAVDSAAAVAAGGGVRALFLCAAAAAALVLALALLAPGPGKGAGDSRGDERGSAKEVGEGEAQGR